jgi:hypothetical protein
VERERREGKKEKKTVKERGEEQKQGEHATF